MGTTPTRKKLSKKRQDELLAILETRFTEHAHRHPDIQWPDVKKKLEDSPSKLWALNEMEDTGGEPDVVRFDKKSGEYTFFDCSAETPKDRVSLCYDRAGYESRKAHHPKNTAIDMAEAIGIYLLTEEQYVELQKLGEFDKKTSCWVETPAKIRKAGGALYCEFRYNRVFTGHNGAQSYYNSRGFRAWLAV